jgi:hypothetical protein
MNLMNFLKRGASHAPSEADRQQAMINKAAEDTRAKWLDAIMADETRAWMGIGEADRGIVEGLTTMLAIGGFASLHDHRDIDSPDLRVIRGAISAAGDCVAGGCVITLAQARAMSSGATRAREAIQRASVGAIIHAAQAIRETVGLPAV